MFRHVKAFDLIFIDADNVVRKGEVAKPGTVDEKVIGVRKFCQALAENKMLKTTALQTFGSKGYDGFSISVVV